MENNSPAPRIISWIPLICGLMFAAGILLGSKINGGSKNSPGFQADKIRAVLAFIKQNYVDSINDETLTDEALVSILQTLDPHSDYYTAAQVKEMNEPMKGNFEGVGIEYNFIHDTLVVMVVIPGGPSEMAGLKAGDQILTANDTSVIGYSRREDYVKSKLRGPAKTQVKISYRRPSENGKIFTTSITRGSIPIYSVDASYMLDNETGYIRLVRFAENSFEEFKKASDSLLKMGMKKMVLDLRANGGGLMDAATNIADEFLKDGQLIVYTKGRIDGEQRTFATKNGKLENIPLTVMVDENSASASEILAGALQDNDRATIVGRRTFGKGLVQIQQGLNDGSAFRLTIARYYTPTGRCIQKPYDKGLEAYQADELNRYRNGELYNRDSIHLPDSLRYKTPKGRTVFGGGGIMPDSFVPFDSIGETHYLDQLFRKDIFIMWALDQMVMSGKSLKQKGLESFRKEFVISDDMFRTLLNIADQNGVSRNFDQVVRSKEKIERYMKANLARLLWDDAAFTMIINDGDPTVRGAMNAFQ